MKNPDPPTRGIRAVWSGTPGSNRRPSAWQTGDQDLQRDASRVNPEESLALERRVEETVASVDAPKCSPSTDAGLTPPQSVASISDDRLFTVAEVSSLLRIRKSDVYRACDQGSLEYVKFEGAVQVEGRDLKRWLGASTIDDLT